MIDSLIFYVIYPLVGIWLLLFSYASIFFYHFIPQKLDRIFLNKTKGFKEAYEDLDLLEKFVNHKLSKVRERIMHYEDNAQRTRRKYSYYSDYIESGFFKIYMGKEKSWKQCFGRLDTPVKLILVFVFSLFISLGLTAVIIAIYAMIIKFNMTIIAVCVFALIILSAMFRLFIKVNYLLLLFLIDGLLILIKKDRNRLYRNIAIMDVMMGGWWKSPNSGHIIGGAGFSGYSGGGYSGGGFGGFGGGSFGGGGAGGSW